MCTPAVFISGCYGDTEGEGWTRDMMYIPDILAMFIPNFWDFAVK